MSAPGVTPHDASPDAALAAIRDFGGPLLLDLDETLYLRNSTEDFIDSARPDVAAAALLKLLDWLRPWRWTGGEGTRDAWRVRLVSALFPWTARHWRRRVPALVAQFGNGALIGTLRRHRTRPVVVTLGFRPIVEPLVAALHIGESGIVAVHADRPTDRLGGKLALALAALGPETVRTGMFVTDSADDLPLLQACARPLRTVWPGARCRIALSDVYLPGRYLTRVKRPGERYIVRGILQEDFALWLLASIGLAPLPLLHAAGLLLLLLSFWAIYERGYVDNDRVAARHEKVPRLSAAFHEAPVPTPARAPWVWALASGGAAIVLLRWPAAPTLADLAAWLAVLLATHAWFRAYNRCDKATRVWLYPGLQLARTAGFCVLVPVAPVGALALAAHVLARWMPYYLYRFGGNDWPEAHLPLTRLLFFTVLVAIVALAQDPGLLVSWTAAALLAWNVVRARGDLRAAITRAHRIDRPPAAPP